MRKKEVLVPTAGSQNVVDVPIYFDPNIFIVCREHAGRPIARTDLTEYLNISIA